MHNLAFKLQSQARHDEAFALMERCSQLRKQVLGEQHPHTKSSHDTLSDWRTECSDESPTLLSYVMLIPEQNAEIT
jgi:hypothetical protein